MKIAVITSTIGRPELEQAIESVQNQQYPCQHYVFVDGKEHFHKVKPLEEKYPNVIFTYLPQNTGKGGWTNSYINAMSAFLVKEDIVCFLDDDNWYEPHHTQVIKNAFERYEIGMAYTMRRFYEEKTDTFICNDEHESLGFWSVKETRYQLSYNNHTHLFSHKTIDGFHIDTNCLALKLSEARYFANAWVQNKRNDRYIVNELLKAQIPSLCTGEITVNYRLNMEKQIFIEDSIHESFGINTTNQKEKERLLFNSIRVINQVSSQQLNQIYYTPHLFNGNLIPLNERLI